MKHLLYGSKSIFVDDAAADVLIDFGSHVAQLRTGARVDLRGYSSEGNEVVTTFLLNGGANLVAETATAPMQDPDNAAAITYMQERMASFSTQPDFFKGFDIDESEQP